MKFIAKLLMKLFGWKLVQKTDTSKIKNAIVIMAPHTSYFDGFIGKCIIKYLGWKCTLLSAPWLFKVPVLGLIMKLIGAIPVEGARSIFHVVNKFKTSDNTKMVICPEGWLKRVDEWNPGFFYMAKKSNVPVIVTTLNYKTKTATIKTVISAEEIQNHTKTSIMETIHNLYNDSDTYAKYPEKFALHKI